MPTAPPSTVQTVVSADGTEIGYELRGSGPGLVLVQGTMGTAYNFRDLAEALAGTFTVVLPDRRGRGYSGPGRSPLRAGPRDRGPRVRPRHHGSAARVRPEFRRDRRALGGPPAARRPRGRRLRTAAVPDPREPPPPGADGLRRRDRRQAAAHGSRAGDEGRAVRPAAGGGRAHADPRPARGPRPAARGEAPADGVRHDDRPRPRAGPRLRAAPRGRRPERGTARRRRPRAAARRQPQPGLSRARPHAGGERAAHRPAGRAARSR